MATLSTATPNRHHLVHSSCFTLLLLALASISLADNHLPLSPPPQLTDNALVQLEQGHIHTLAENYTSAHQSYLKAAEQGLDQAQYHLALSYIRGKGIKKNYRLAAQWLQRAAQQGMAAAQYGLGNLYDQGKGVIQNNELAHQWYLLAAEQGLAIAQHNLGVIYATGQGVPQDNINAYKWWHLAAINGKQDSLTFRDLISKKMTALEIETAQNLVVDWLATHEINFSAR